MLWKKRIDCAILKLTIREGCKMAQQLVSTEQVKQALGIESFRNLSKDKIIEFVSLIPNMDKEVSISIINQFPISNRYRNAPQFGSCGALHQYTTASSAVKPPREFAFTWAQT